MTSYFNPFGMNNGSEASCCMGWERGQGKRIHDYDLGTRTHPKVSRIAAQFDSRLQNWALIFLTLTVRVPSAHFTPLKHGHTHANTHSQSRTPHIACFVLNRSTACLSHKAENCTRYNLIFPLSFFQNGGGAINFRRVLWAHTHLFFAIVQGTFRKSLNYASQQSRYN